MICAHRSRALLHLNCAKRKTPVRLFLLVIDPVAEPRACVPRPPVNLEMAMISNAGLWSRYGARVADRVRLLVFPLYYQARAVFRPGAEAGQTVQKLAILLTLAQSGRYRAPTPGVANCIAGVRLPGLSRRPMACSTR